MHEQIATLGALSKEADETQAQGSQRCGHGEQVADRDEREYGGDHARGERDITKTVSEASILLGAVPRHFSCCDEHSTHSSDPSCG